MKVIQSFKDTSTYMLFTARKSRDWNNIAAVALRKLDQLNAARSLADLRIPPGNRLEALRGKRKGQQSVRINDQWRIGFVWISDSPHEVEIVNYHS